MTQSPDIAGGPVTTLQAGRFGARIPAGVKKISLFQIVQNDSDALPTSLTQWVQGFLREGKTAAECQG